MIGKEVAGVLIETPLGEGGMGIVYRGKRLSDGTSVAVKFIRDEESADREFTERFEREARILGALDHENILKLYDWGRFEGGAYYIVMELVDGCSLRDILHIWEKLEPHYALEIALSTARALESAWKSAVIHRDIKPDNILIGRGGVVKLVDFGLAKDTSDNQKFTLTGQVVGTPAFMSPEQGLGDKVDHRSDIYSLGVTLFTMLAGRRPFEGSTPMELVIQQINAPPPDLEELRPDLPKHLYALIGKMMAKSPEDRFEDVSKAMAGIEAILNDLEGGDTTIADLVEETAEHLDLGGSPQEALTVAADSSATPVTGAVPDEGKEVIAGKYELKKKLGAGGMGTVYLARHRTLNQDFALKLLNPFLASNEAFRTRFMREAKAASAFVHKHAVQIREFGEDGPILYMTMDYCPGRTLESLLEEGPIPERRASSIAHQMLSALKEAHAAGLIHRDLKPANVMIEDREGRDMVRILDFGVAKLASTETAEDSKGHAITRPGAIMGTVQYMSPEQAMGEKIDARSDLYALATILYESITGRLPFEAGNPRKMMYRLVTEKPDPLSKRVKGVSKKFERLIMRNLSKDRDARCASAQEFLAELEAVSSELKSSVAIRRKGLPAWLQAAFGALILVVGAATVLSTWNPFAPKGASAPVPGVSTPEETEAKISAEAEAYETLRRERNFPGARDRAFTLLLLARTPEERMRWEEAKQKAEAEIRGAGKTLEQAQAHDDKGELLKALPLYLASREQNPFGEQASSCAQRAKAIQAELDAFVGLKVTSEPPNARVFLDGEMVGTTPALVRDVSPGRHVVTLDLAGYYAETRPVDWAGEGLEEVHASLRPGAFGKILVVSASREKLFVRYMGEIVGPTPAEVEKAEAGGQTVEVVNGEGVAYTLLLDVKKGKTNLVTADFPRLLAEELEAWTNLNRGSTAVETLAVHRRFLQTFPRGKFASRARTIVEKLEAEEEAFRRCATERSPNERLRACSEYRLAYGDKEYPLGWHAEEVRRIEQSILDAREREAWGGLEGAEDHEAERRACLDYLKAFPAGKRAVPARERLRELEAEEAMHGSFAREPVFWKKLARGREYLERFPGGWWAEEVGLDIDARLSAEKEASEAILGERSVEVLLEAHARYREGFSGGPHAEALMRRVQEAEEERRVFRRASDSPRNCQEYVSRYPQGWYRKEAEELMRSFAWPAADNGGVGFDGKLPPGLKRAESVGEYVSETDGAVMVYVPKGFFPMGSDDWRGKEADGPGFMAWVSGFFIDKYEVSNSRYARFMEWMRTAKDPHRSSHPDMPEGKDLTPAFWDESMWNVHDHPVVGVDWFDAFAFARWAGKRLPTEAQWEKAACADVVNRRKLRWPWGDERPKPEFCVFLREPGREGTMPVHSFPPGRSPLGVFHMAGNASEWCLDAFETGFYAVFSKSPYGITKWASNPFNGKDSPIHTIRGGSWADKGRNLVSSRRRGFSGRNERVGFRCALWHNPRTVSGKGE